ncbi:MAG TPA: hypothetical protein VFE48_02030 [Methylomirabilota bacterium]|nr:hypothetical protein [Methylomirabilota bacterium]
MSPGGHLVTTAVACAVIYEGTGSAELVAGLAAGGFLIDVDHMLDYVLFERQRDLRPTAFLRYYLGGRAERVVLMLHSYELLAVLAALAWFFPMDWLWGWVFGMMLHLPLDVIFNGKFASRGLVHFYSIVVRARAGFRAARFTDRPVRPVGEHEVWTAFFEGGRVAGEAPGSAPAGRPSVPVRG